MPTLVFSPGVRAYIQTTRAGLVDVTEDITRGQVVRNTGKQPSTWRLSLSNRRRKYDRLFTPNDRVTIFLKRLYWLQSMSGYINGSPYYNAKPSEVTLTGSCTMKYLQYFHWDPTTSASQTLLNAAGPDTTPTDSGVGPNALDRITNLLTEVTRWERDRIHIGNVPPDWQNLIDTVVDDVRGEQDTISQRGSLTSGATGPFSLGTTHPDRSTTDNPSIGVFRETEGKASHFGGTDDTSTSGHSPALTNEVAPNWNDPWYLALRIPTQRWSDRTGPDKSGAYRADNLTADQFNEGRQWWRNRKVLVTNPTNGRQFVGRVADIGPSLTTNKAIDMSQHALGSLRASSGVHLSWTFASDSAPLGEVTDTTTAIARAGRLSVPSPVPDGADPRSADFAWGGFENGQIPASSLTEVTDRNGAFLLHPLAAEAYVQMRSAAEEQGIMLRLSSGYRSYARQVSIKDEKGDLAAEPGTSKHGWGMAVDLNASEFDSERYLWLRDNGARYGWVNPPRLRDDVNVDEPWHWEFWGIFGAHRRAATRTTSGRTTYQVDIRPDQFDSLGNGIAGTQPVLSGAAEAISPTGSAPSTSSGIGLDNNGLYATEGWLSTDVREDPAAIGPMLHSNDEPILPTIGQLVHAAGREMASAPNGDFIAWFPDYFNLHNYAAIFDLVTMEVGDFSVKWSDERLSTHFFVSGAVGPGGAGPAVAGNISDPTTARYISKGVASLEHPSLLKVLLGSEDGDALTDAATLLRRFGVRPKSEQLNNIIGPDAEFYIAVTRFMANWAQQFSATIPIASFLPGVYPGMIVRCEELNFQAYVNRVTHTFSYQGGMAGSMGSAGFGTSLDVIAPSRLDSGGLLGAALDAVRELEPVGRQLVP